MTWEGLDPKTTDRSGHGFTKHPACLHEASLAPELILHRTVVVAGQAPQRTKPPHTGPGPLRSQVRTSFSDLERTPHSRYSLPAIPIPTAPVVRIGTNLRACQRRDLGMSGGERGWGYPSRGTLARADETKPSFPSDSSLLRAYDPTTGELRVRVRGMFRRVHTPDPREVEVRV